MTFFRDGTKNALVMTSFFSSWNVLFWDFGFERQLTRTPSRYKTKTAPNDGNHLTGEGVLGWRLACHTIKSSGSILEHNSRTKTDSRMWRSFAKTGVGKG